MVPSISLRRACWTPTRHVTRDRGVFRLAGDLVDLVDVDDALHGPLDVVLSGLKEAQDDVLHVLADIAGLGEAGGVADGEGNIQEAGKGLGEKGLACSRGAHQENVGLLEFDIVVAGFGIDALVVVVHCDSEDFLGSFLAHDVLIEVSFDVFGLGNQGAGGLVILTLEFLGDDLVAQLHALVAHIDRRSSNQLADLLLRLSAERAAQLTSFSAFLRCHALASLKNGDLYGTLGSA